MNSVQVAVRVRPLLSGETGTNNMELHSESRRVLFGSKIFDCDYLLNDNTSQENVYNTCCREIIEMVLAGGKGTILVYGQTGTGKTHTIFGTDPQKCDGVLFQSLRQILNSVQNISTTISISLLEIYMEKVTDLQTGTLLSIFHGTPHNLSWRVVCTIEEAAHIVFDALSSRHTASTLMNDRSSRSHVIVNLKILTKEENNMDDVSDHAQETSDNLPLSVSRLSFIDLAGSECVGKSKSLGKALQEASTINRSLLSLRKIIMDLSNPHVPLHISYRDSKLTELLQDSFGGYSKTLMLACISSSARDVEETKSTLEYATRARLIKNLLNTEKEKLQLKIKGLQYDIQKLKNKLEIQASERGHVVTTRAEFDELTRRSALVDTLENKLREAVQCTENHANIAEYNQGMIQKIRQVVQSKQDLIANLRKRLSTNAQQLKPIFDECTDALNKILDDAFQSFQVTHSKLQLTAVRQIYHERENWIKALGEGFDRILSLTETKIRTQFQEINTLAQNVLDAAPPSHSTEEFQNVVPELRTALTHALELLERIEQNGSVVYERADRMRQKAELTQTSTRSIEFRTLFSSLKKALIGETQDAHLRQQEEYATFIEREFSECSFLRSPQPQLATTLHDFFSQMSALLQDLESENTVTDLSTNFNDAQTSVVYPQNVNAPLKRKKSASTAVNFPAESQSQFEESNTLNIESEQNTKSRLAQNLRSSAALLEKGTKPRAPLSNSVSKPHI